MSPYTGFGILATLGLVALVGWGLWRRMGVGVHWHVANVFLNCGLVLARATEGTLYLVPVHALSAAVSAWSLKVIADES